MFCTTIDLLSLYFSLIDHLAVGGKQLMPESIEWYQRYIQNHDYQIVLHGSKKYGYHNNFWSFRWIISEKGRDYVYVLWK